MDGRWVTSVVGERSHDDDWVPELVLQLDCHQVMVDLDGSKLDVRVVAEGVLALAR